jgi:hypothetical protein
MTQANRVLSTSSTPIDTTRRHLLTIAAGGAVAAAIPAGARAGHAADPIFAAIEAHRQAARIYYEAVRVEFASDGKVTEAASARLNETTSEATHACFAAGRALVTTQPTTMLGAIAMLQYLATAFDEPGIPTESNIMPETVDDEAWTCAVFRTLASALAQVQS